MRCAVLVDIVLWLHSAFPLPPLTATEMWCLGRFLPLLVGDLVPEDNAHWEHFLQLLQIIDYLFAPRTSIAITQHMAILIQDFLLTWRELYPSRSLTPKMHYSVHFPAWAARWAMWYLPHVAFTLSSIVCNLLNLRCGPLVNYWWTTGVCDMKLSTVSLRSCQASLATISTYHWHWPKDTSIYSATGWFALRNSYTRTWSLGKVRMSGMYICPTVSVYSCPTYVHIHSINSGLSYSRRGARGWASGRYRTSTDIQECIKLVSIDAHMEWILACILLRIMNMCFSRAL